jgi:hypothetical protein
VRAPDKAKLNSRSIATITAATRTNFSYDAWLDDVYARTNEQLDQAAREDFAVPVTIPDAAMVVPRAQQRGLG